MGKNTTFYVNNDNLPEFEKEEHPNTLLNSLLSSHYSGNVTVTNASASKNAQMRVVSRAIDLGEAIAAHKGGSVCPNGHLLAADHRCLTKDCKYS